jgi:hypothetical protein
MRAITVTKFGGEREVWDPRKVERSLRATHATDETIDQVMQELDTQIFDGIHTKDLYKKAFAILRRLSRPAAARYSLRNAIMELGPSGFPFEKFFAEVLKAEGYHTQVGTIVKGFCVEHEVDIIAEREGERIMIEAKYHNTQKTKTDVKVALYVKARYDDILKKLDTSAAGIGFFTQPWLITNTSFTDQAIQYAECAGLKLLGWNYPRGDTMQDIIERTHTHPITALTSLTVGQKQALITVGCILARDLITHPDYLTKLGIARGRQSAIMREVQGLYNNNQNGTN